MSSDEQPTTPGAVSDPTSSRETPTRWWARLLDWRRHHRLGATALALMAVIGPLLVWWFPRPPPSVPRPELSLVSVSQTPDGRAVVDITVRNDGTQVAEIRGVDFDITSRSIVTGSGPLQVTGEYDVVVPAGLAIPSTVDVSIRHTVDPAGSNAVDRFTVTMAADGSLFAFYEFQVSVRTSETTLTWPETFRVRLDGLGNQQDGSLPDGLLPDKDTTGPAVSGDVEGASL